MHYYIEMMDTSYFRGPNDYLGWASKSGESPNARTNPIAPPNHTQLAAASLTAKESIGLGECVEFQFRELADNQIGKAVPLILIRHHHPLP